MGKVKNRDFVVAWIDACEDEAGVRQVARTLEISLTRAYSKANYLRKIGVALPKMQTQRTSCAKQARVNVLNDIIAARIVRG